MIFVPLAFTNDALPVGLVPAGLALSVTRITKTIHSESGSTVNDDHEYLCNLTACLHSPSTLSYSESFPSYQSTRLNVLARVHRKHAQSPTLWNAQSAGSFETLNWSLCKPNSSQMSLNLHPRPQDRCTRKDIHHKLCCRRNNVNFENMITSAQRLTCIFPWFRSLWIWRRWVQHSLGRGEPPQRSLKVWRMPLMSCQYP